MGIQKSDQLLGLIIRRTSSANTKLQLLRRKDDATVNNCHKNYYVKIYLRSVRGEGTSTGISDKGPVLAMVMTWAAVVYATLTLLYWFCDSGYNYN